MFSRLGAKWTCESRNCTSRIHHIETVSHARGTFRTCPETVGARRGAACFLFGNSRQLWPDEPLNLGSWVRPELPAASNGRLNVFKNTNRRRVNVARTRCAVRARQSAHEPHRLARSSRTSMKETTKSRSLPATTYGAVGGLSFRGSSGFASRRHPIVLGIPFGRSSIAPAH